MNIAQKISRTVMIIQKICFYNFWPILVHRCGAGGSMRACHAAGPGSIPGWDKLSG